MVCIYCREVHATLQLGIYVNGWQYSIMLFNNHMLFDSFFCPFYLFIYLRFYIYLTERESERAQAGGAAEGEGEAGSPLSREPD